MGDFCFWQAKTVQFGPFCTILVQFGPLENSKMMATLKFYLKVCPDHVFFQNRLQFQMFVCEDISMLSWFMYKNESSHHFPWSLLDVNKLIKISGSISLRDMSLQMYLVKVLLFSTWSLPTKADSRWEVWKDIVILHPPGYGEDDRLASSHIPEKMRKMILLLFCIISCKNYKQA